MNDSAPPAGRILGKKERGIGWVIFSNTAKHNAVSLEMWESVPPLIASYDADPEVRVIVITGDGEKAFVSGADISQFDKNRGSAEARAVYDAALDAGYAAPAKCSKPVVAKIRGICMGGGLGLAAACDMRIAADNAIFRMPAARLGLGYGFSGLQRMTALLGPGYAADIFFTARKFDAREAKEMGFVTHVFPVAEFDAKADELIGLIAENAPLTLAAAKYGFRQLAKNPGERDLGGVEARVARCFDSEDYKEGRRAFLEKRPPKFQGR